MELEEIERQFEMDEILFFRSLAERKMPLEVSVLHSTEIFSCCSSSVRSSLFAGC